MPKRILAAGTVVLLLLVAAPPARAEGVDPTLLADYDVHQIEDHAKAGKIDFPSDYWTDFPGAGESKLTPELWKRVTDACDKARADWNAQHPDKPVADEAEEFHTTNPVTIGAIKHVRGFDVWANNYPDAAMFAKYKNSMSDAEWKALMGECDKHLLTNYGTTDPHAVTAIKVIRLDRSYKHPIDESIFAGNWANASKEGRKALEDELRKGPYAKASPPLSDKDKGNPDYTWGSGVTRNMSPGEVCRNAHFGEDMSMIDAECGTHHVQDLERVAHEIVESDTPLGQRMRAAGQQLRGYGTDDANAQKVIAALRQARETHRPLDMKALFPDSDGEAIMSDEGVAAVKAEAARLGFTLTTHSRSAGLVGSLEHWVGIK